MASITGRQVVLRANGYSSANDPGVTALDPELLEVLRAKLRVLYNRATRLNPFFSAVHEDVAPVDGKWQRPDGALRLIHIEGTGLPTGAGHVVEPGAEVHNVSLKDRFLAADPPRVYREGGCYYSVGKAGDPNNVSERLRFYYAEDSPGVENLDECLPEWFHDEHEELIVALVAIFIATKDKARTDLAALKELVYGDGTPNDPGLIGEFDDYVKEADLNVVGRFDRHAGQGLSAQGRAQ